MVKRCRYRRSGAKSPWVIGVLLLLPFLTMAGDEAKSLTAFVDATLIDGTGGVPSGGG